MLMAAMRLNVPAIMVSGGPMLAGHLDGRAIDLNSVFEAVGRHQAGTLDDEGLKALECSACPTCGSCSGLFTANSMNCLAEVIGMALPGNGTIPAPYSERLRFAKDSGAKVMDVLAAGLAPRDILTDAAVGNALAADASSGLQHQHRAAPGGDRHRGRARVPAAAHQRGRRQRCRTSASSRRPASTTWKTCTAPAASRRS